MNKINELKKKDIIVNHLSEVDFSGMRAPFIAVYAHPLLGIRRENERD